MKTSLYELQFHKNLETFKEQYRKTAEASKKNTLLELCPKGKFEGAGRQFTEDDLKKGGTDEKA